MFQNVLYVFLISMLPIIELRGAVPVGAALGIPFYWNALAAVIGNILPVPFILLFIPKLLDLLSRFRIFRPIVLWLRKKADKHSAKIIGEDKGAEGAPQQDGTVQNAEILDTGVGQTQKKRIRAATFLGLLLFVMIPCPGTGAWTGSLVAALFDLPKKQSFFAALLGVIGCAVIMCLASYGILGFLSFLM